MSDYQVRKDIDKIYTDFYNLTDGTLKLVTLKEDSELRYIKDENNNNNLDAILNYYGLLDNKNDYWSQSNIGSYSKFYLNRKAQLCELNVVLDDYSIMANSEEVIDTVSSAYLPTAPVTVFLPLESRVSVTVDVDGDIIIRNYEYEDISSLDVNTSLMWHYQLEG